MEKTGNRYKDQFELCKTALENLREDQILKRNVVFCHHEKSHDKTKRAPQFLQSSERPTFQFVSSMTSLVNALEAKDPYTAEHSIRVSNLAGKIAEHRNGVSPEVKEVQMAGKLHDIGKVGTPERILHKPENLTKEEFDHIKKHPLLAEKILAPFEKLKSVSNVIKHHHERFDGKGYPDGLAGKDIPELSRILAIVDSYDAMTSARPYRTAMIAENAMGEIRKGLGTQFDPEFGEIFIRLFLTGRMG